MAELKLISAESVTEGHPDKVCDQISDAILDDMLAQDPHSHVAVETCATVGQFFVFGEVTSEGYSDIQNIVRSVVRNIGYTSSRVGLDADSCGVTVSLTEQSPEINQGVARLSGEEESKASREQRYEAQGAGERAGDLRHLQRMGEAGPVVIAFVKDEHLRLVLQAPECRRVDDAVAIALELAACNERRFIVAASARVNFGDGVEGELQHSSS